MGEQFAHDLGEQLLVFDRAGEPVEIGAGALFDGIAPHLDDFLAMRRRREPGQALAGEQRQRVLERRVLAA